MDQLQRTAALQAKILNAAYMVRHYSRGGLSSIGAKQRDEAIRLLGEVIRDAFAETTDYEPLLITFFNGLSRDDRPPF